VAGRVLVPGRPLTFIPSRPAMSPSGRVMAETWVFPGWKLAAHTSRVVPSKQSRGRYEGRPRFFGLKPMAAFSWRP